MVVFQKQVWFIQIMMALKYFILISLMLADIVVVLFAAILLHLDGNAFVLALIVGGWFLMGGFDAWKPHTIKAFLINFDSYMETGQPKVIALFKRPR